MANTNEGGGSKYYSNHKRDCRPKKECRPIYECPPPTPVCVRCSVCHSAERADSGNIWSCVSFLSYPKVVGVSLDLVLIHLLNLLPIKGISWLGIGHEKACRAKVITDCCDPCCKKSKKVCDPCCSPCKPCDPCCPCKPCKTCTKPCNPCTKPCDPCKPTNPCKPSNAWKEHCGRGDAGSAKTGDNLQSWMQAEYLGLARELADLKHLTSEDVKDGGDERDKDLLQARNYVLDRLAEMLAKREEIEKRMKKKKTKGKDNG